MKQLNYILLIVLTFSFVGCQDALGPQLQDTSKVKTETKWRVSSVNNSKISKVSYRTFNQKGEVLRVVIYDENGLKRSCSEFNYKGSTKTELEIQFSNGDTVGVFKHDFVLDNGKVTKKITVDVQGHIINSEQFIYDNNGNVKEKLFCENDEDCENRILYDNQYSDGSLTSRSTFDVNGEISQKDSIIYSINQDFFEKITTDRDGNVFFSTSYSLDNNGNITTEVIKNSKGQIVDKYIYEFIFFD